MTAIVSAAVRIFAIYLLLSAFRFSTYVFHMDDFSYSIGEVIIMVAFAVLLPAVFAGMMWTRPRFFARLLLPNSKEEFERSTLSESQLFSVLAVILGLYLTISGGADLIGSLIEIFFVFDVPNAYEYEAGRYWAYAIRPAIEFVLGVVLILRLRGLKFLYLRLQEGGLDNKLNDE